MSSMADIAPAQGLGFSVRDLLRIAPPVADNFFGDIVFSYRGGKAKAVKVTEVATVDEKPSPPAGSRPRS